MGTHRTGTPRTNTHRTDTHRTDAHKTGANDHHPAPSLRRSPTGRQQQDQGVTGKSAALSGSAGTTFRCRMSPRLAYTRSRTRVKIPNGGTDSVSIRARSSAE